MNIIRWGILLAALLIWGSRAQGFAAVREGSKPPNILLILADDLGYSDVGCYGGEIQTPHLDRLAAGGLRFTQFYNTARCWPTRSCLLTGYYAQQIRMDPMLPGPRPEWCRLLPHYLSPLGYRCYHSGKWHIENTPRILVDGGFHRSYNLRDHNVSFAPRDHREDDRPLPKVAPNAGYYHTTGITDYLIKYLREHSTQHASQPFFAYLAFTSPHFPLHALPADIAKYQGTYQRGWDIIRRERYQRQLDQKLVQCGLSLPEPGLKTALIPNNAFQILGAGEAPHAVPWQDLTPTQQSFQAIKMSLHAAMIDRIDQEIGRVITQIQSMGSWEDTLVVFLSDNGASAEILVRGDGHDPQAAPGSAKSYLCLGPGWSTSSNTPFRRHKIWVNEGGISTPCIVHWPRGLTARGELRHQVAHLVDLLPTLVDVAGGSTAPKTDAKVPVPPLPGKSLQPVFQADLALGERELFFQHSGSKALRSGDWKAIASVENPDQWALYNLKADRQESQDLSASAADRLRQMVSRWKELETLFRRQEQTGVPDQPMNKKR